MPEIRARGADISEWNGDVDVSALAGQVDFLIIRCGYGGNYTFQDDTEFESNVRKCDAAGIPYGVYLYSYAKTADMALSEADHTLRLLQGKRPLYGVWYDVEDASLPTGDTLVENCIAYCSAVEEAGYYCGLYASLSWMESRLNDSRLDRFDKWVAQWNATLDYTGDCGMWQYTNGGVIGGKVFDLDYAFRDYPAIIREMEEGTTMTKEEVARLARQEAQAVYRENEEKYATIEAVPRWAREAVRQVYEELGLAGASGSSDGEIVLDAGDTYIRALYVIARVLDLLPAEDTLEAPGARGSALGECRDENR